VTPSDKWRFPDSSGVAAGPGLGMKPQRPHVDHRRPALLPPEEGRPMTSSPATMRAVRLSAPGPVGNLRLTTLPLPPEQDGWVRIRIEAFGLNRSELKLDPGEVAPAVRELYPDGVDAALDLVGTPTPLPDTLRAVRVHGTACFGGSLPN